MHRQPASAGTFPVTAAVLTAAIRETPCVINNVHASNKNIRVTYTVYKVQSNKPWIRFFTLTLRSRCNRSLTIFTRDIPVVIL